MLPDTNNMSNPNDIDKPIQSLQVLSNEGGITIGTVHDMANPVVVLDDHAAASLLQHWRIASAQAAELKTDHRVDAVLKLCESFGRVMDQYVATRNKYFGGQKFGDCDWVVAEL